MRVNLRVRRSTPGIDKAHNTLVGSLNRALDALGRHLQRSLRSRVRKFRGDEAKNIKYEVRGQGLKKLLTVYGDLVQLWVDEFGLRPGTFPPWGVNTLLYLYARRKGLAQRPHAERHNAGVKRRPRRVSHVRSRRPRPAGPGDAARPKTRRRRAATNQGQSPGQRRPQRQVAREKATRRLAFLLARAIFERGIKAGAPIKRTLEANRAKIIRDVSNAFTRAVNAINRGR